MSNKTQVRPISMQLNQAICEIEVLQNTVKELKSNYGLLLDKNLNLRMSNNEHYAEIRKRDALLDNASETMIKQNQEINRLVSLLNGAKEKIEKKSFFRRIFGL